MVTVASSVTSSAAGTLMTLVVAVRSAVQGPEDDAFTVTVRRLLAGTSSRTGSPGHPELPEVTTAIRPAVVHTTSSRNAYATPGGTPR